MLENIQAVPATESAPVVKRYAPPNQRNRSANRRKSSDRLDRTNSIGAELEKNQVASSRSVHIPDHGDAGSSNLINENHHSRLIALEGCGCSAASQLLNDRPLLVLSNMAYAHLFLLESRRTANKPVMYSSGASAWTQQQFRPPQQVMQPSISASSSCVSQQDFLAELRRQMQNANPSST
ncbi:hypothetical protein V8G54_008701 [Vigna mungo]|uniref:Uncharacterized protein n=1 Tax=Vigna mungo TaxID=3915 RepID=A0AAQ3SAA3_VIGMU